ncbi:unnamed protein product [Callosobruchus maculatus]|uniref:Uncharacterized protein n=1 Tax=Callosobruchus maculatus TaxID=64391 RepID=A0A653CCN3_CALMS|nr:unnamed protein product [Callosobruchus maculatus]
MEANRRESQEHSKKVVPYVRNTCGRINQAIDSFYGAPMPYYPQYNSNINPVIANQTLDKIHRNLGTLEVIL